MSSHYCSARRRVQAVVACVLVVVMLAGCGGGLLDNHRAGGDEGFAVPSGLYTKIGTLVLSNLIKWGGSEGMGWLLSLVSTPPEDKDQEILDKMDEMNDKLNTILHDLGQIKTELDEVLSAISMTEHDIISNEENLQIADDLTLLDNQYVNLQYYTSDMVGTPDGQAKAQQFATDILGTGYDIDQKLANIYAGIMGTSIGINDGAMAAWTTTLIDQMDNSNVLDLYNSLEYYFATLLNTQAKGLTLMVEALHWQEYPNGGSVPQAEPGLFPGTAQEFYDEKFIPNIEDEVEEFLRNVDRLTVASLDLRTSTISQVQMVPDEVRTIYQRADFIAAVNSSRHSLGLTLRLIGNSDIIKQYVIGEWQLADRHLPLAVEQVGNGGSKLDVRDTAVEYWTNWPTGYRQAYMSWAWKSFSENTVAHAGWYAFKPTTTVAVQMLNTDRVGAGTYAVTGDPGHDPQTYTAQVFWYDENMVKQAAATRYPFGSLVVPIRHHPTWYEGLSYTDGDSRLDRQAFSNVTPGFGPTGVPYTATAITLKQNIHSYNSAATYLISSALDLRIYNTASTAEHVGTVLDVELSKNGNIPTTSADLIEAYWYAATTGDKGSWSAVQGNFSATWHPYCTIDAGDYGKLEFIDRQNGSTKGSDGDSKSIVGLVGEAYLYL